MVVFVFVRIIVPRALGGRGDKQRAWTRNVEICEFSQKCIKALLFTVPVDLAVD
jgi:hypothetical protein